MFRVCVIYAPYNTEYQFVKDISCSNLIFEIIATQLSSMK
jgi:hypothetical protein